jgi:hypothetical protein
MPWLYKTCQDRVKDKEMDEDGNYWEEQSEYRDGYDATLHQQCCTELNTGASRMIAGSGGIFQKKDKVCCNARYDKTDPDSDGNGKWMPLPTEITSMAVPTGIHGLSFESGLLDGEPIAEWFTAVWIGMRHSDREFTKQSPVQDPEDRIIEFRLPVLSSGYVKSADEVGLALFGFEVLGKDREMLDPCKYPSHLIVGHPQLVRPNGRRLRETILSTRRATRALSIKAARQRRRLWEQKATLFEDQDGDTCLPVEIAFYDEYKKLCVTAPPALPLPPQRAALPCARTLVKALTTTP